MAKRDRKSRYLNSELYDDLESNNDFEDTRYWGLFLRNKRVLIDPIRMKKKTEWAIKPEMWTVMANRKTHYFMPAKIHYQDYNVNIIVDSIVGFIEKWEKVYHPDIQSKIDEIVPPVFTPGDDDSFMSGISTYGAANARAIFKNHQAIQQAQNQRFEIIASRYSQFFHMMVSGIEANIIKVLHKNNAMDDIFNRNILYGTCNGKSKKFQEIEGYSDFDKMYAIWNFIKHNSKSTFQSIVDKYPEVLLHNEYNQGNLAIYYINFNNDLILGLLKANIQFFINYCLVVYGEDYSQAKWNYDDHFKSIVSDQRDLFLNPLGLDMFDDID